MPSTRILGDRGSSSVTGRLGRLMLVLVTAWHAVPAYAQVQAPPQPTSAPSTVSESALTDLTEKDVTDRRDQIDAATDLPETLKVEAGNLYKQALDQLNVATNWSNKAAEYADRRAQAPAHREEAKSALADATTGAAISPAPPISPEDTLEAVTQKLADAEADLKAAQDQAKKLDDESKYRQDRMTAIPNLLAEANKRLEALGKELSVAPAAGVHPQMTLARRTLLLAQKKAIEAEIRAYEEELRLYDARSDILSIRRDAAKLNVAAEQAKATAMQDAVSARRQAEVERQKRQAEEDLRLAPPLVRDLAEENAQRAQEAEEIAEKIQRTAGQVQTVKAQYDELGKAFADYQSHVNQPALEDYLGPLMRSMRADLRGHRRYERDLRANKRELTQTGLRLSQIEHERANLVNIDSAVGEVVLALSGDLPDKAKIDRLQPQIREILQARRRSLEMLREYYGTYEKDLIDLGIALDGMVARVSEFSRFIDRHVFWIRSSPAIHHAELPDDWWRAGRGWAELGKGLLRDAAANPSTYASGLLLLALLAASRRKGAERLRELGDRVARASTDSYALTWRALFATLVLALPVPTLTAFLGWRLSSASDLSRLEDYDLAQAAGRGLLVAAALLLSLSCVRQACRAKGLALSHFRWDPKAVAVVRRNVIWLTLLAPPLAFVVAATEQHSNNAWRESLGRVAFIVGVAAAAVFVDRLLRPQRGLARPRSRLGKGRWAQWRWVWFIAAIVAPLGLAGASAAGYHYTAVELTKRLLVTVWVCLGVVLVHGLSVRWVFMSQRKLALERARRQQEEAAAAPAGDEAAVSDRPGPIDEAQLDLVTIGAQTRKLLRTTVILALVIGVWLVWSDLLPALDFMREVKLWTQTVQVAGPGGVAAGQLEFVTLASLTLAIIVIVATVLLARNIPGLLEITILPKLPTDAGGRFAITAIARYAIAVAGVLVAFGVIGIGWSKVQWLVAAMTVGLGFGLQEIFANFVSGLMLLFERPIRIGDTVTVGNVSGTVTRIRIRATTITAWDRKELVIPNKEFITGQIVNWSLSDSIVRLVVPVGIAYGSDTDLAEKLIFEAARETPHILDDPPTKALFVGFGDSSLNYELRVFVPSVDHFLQVRHDLHKAIDRKFRRAGVEIAFPQRDVHLKGIEGPTPFPRPEPMPVSRARPGSDSHGPAADRE